MDNSKVINRESVKDIFENDIKGRNFLLQGKLEYCLKMEHEEIYYAEKEDVFIVVFKQDLMGLLLDKINEKNKEREEWSTQNTTMSQN